MHDFILPRNPMDELEQNKKEAEQRLNEEEQQDTVNETQQEANQVAPTPPSPPPSHKNLIIGIVAVLVIGAFIVIASLLPHSPPRDSSRIGDFKQLYLALELYYDSNGSYPVGDYKTIGPVLVSGGFITQKSEDYLNKRGKKYSYTSDENGNSYVLRVELANVQNAALNSDLDGLVLAQDCDDPYYCVGSPKKIESQSSVDTSDWKTCRLNEGKFEFKYPPQWSLYPSCMDGVTLVPPNKQVITTGPGHYYFGDIFIDVYQNLNGLSLEKYYQEEKERNINLFQAAENYNSLQTNGDEAYKFNNIPGFYTNTHAAFKKGDFIVEIVDIEGGHQEDGVFDQILSTFKFIEPQVTTGTATQMCINDCSIEYCSNTGGCEDPDYLGCTLLCYGE